MNKALKSILMTLIVGAILLFLMLPLASMMRHPGGLPDMWYVITVSAVLLLLCALGLLFYLRFRHIVATLLLMGLILAYGWILRHQHLMFVQWLAWKDERTHSSIASHNVKQLGPSFPFQDFAGKYVEGNGRYGTLVTVTADGQFQFSTYQDVIGAPGKHVTGKLLVKDGVLKLVAVSAIKFEEEWQRPAQQLLPVRWGDRRYLVRLDYDGIKHFCNAINSGVEPRDPGPGFPYLREGDEEKKVVGLPDLPKSWLTYLEKLRRQSSADQEEVLIATIPNSAVKSAWAALNRAGIAYGTDGSRATAIRVLKQDVVRAREILKADARSHQYKITFAD
jgi:hypothetical protein